jgi:O-antigen/teichoic acid export membrane protein
MSRLRNVARSLASGYAVTASNVVYTLGSVPLALHYLTNEEFGLWALVMQVSGYLTLIDLGMSGSVYRILIDHKDQKSDGVYGSVIKTGCLVLLTQGAIIALAGTALSFWLPSLMHAPAGLAPTFRLLVAGQCVLLGAFFGARILTHILQAHQRFDILNYSGMAQLAVSFGVQWAGFHAGLGLYSLLLANLIAMLCGSANNLAAVLRLKQFAPRESRGRPSRKIFRELFWFGTEVFLLQLGMQLVNASQIVIVSRTLGLGAAAIWAIATKAFVLAQQMVLSIFDVSGSALGEMVVRGEKERLAQRFRDLVAFTASLAVFIGTSVAVCNGSFLAVWTKGRVSWPWQNDVLMGISLFLASVSRCYLGLTIYTKQIGFGRFVYLLEGATFIALGFLAAPRLGMGGMVVAAILANLAWSGTYGVRRSEQYFGVPGREIVFGWLGAARRYLLVIVLPAIAIWWATRMLPAWPRLLSAAVVMAAMGLSLLWHFGLSEQMRRESKGVVGSLLSARPG